MDQGVRYTISAGYHNYLISKNKNQFSRLLNPLEPENKDIWDWIYETRFLHEKNKFLGFLSSNLNHKSEIKGDFKFDNGIQRIFNYVWEKIYLDDDYEDGEREPYVWEELCFVDGKNTTAKQI